MNVQENDSFAINDDRSSNVSTVDIGSPGTSNFPSPNAEKLKFAEQKNETASSKRVKVLTLQGLPHQLLEMEYAVRGAIVIRADELKRKLKLHPEGFTKFQEIIPANIGNPQAVGQKAITFNRQLLALLFNPTLLEDDQECPKTDDSAHARKTDVGESRVDVSKSLFPMDVKTRAQRYLRAFPSFGAYSHSKGLEIFRDDIAEWFERRDGFACDPETIFLTDGASSAIRMVLELLIDSSNDGILIPVPQYPLYTASITRLKGNAVEYFLDESNKWKLTSTELNRAINEARAKGLNVKAIAIINPGNPTGSLLRKDEMIDIIRFCEKEGIVILADEVYQDNIYCDDAEFIPFRKLVKSLKSEVQLISFHSCSKGLAGECGIRGGLMQLENVDSDVIAVLYKMASVILCSNTVGQAMLTSLLTPPLPNQSSYELYHAETQAIFNSLKRKALYATKKFNEMDGVSCQPIDGSMYAFPKITIPPEAMKVAHQQGIEPDMLYCMEMLEETGVACVPGSGFCQAPGTYHYRVTILPAEDDFVKMLCSMHNFHDNFLRKYGSTES